MNGFLVIEVPGLLRRLRIARHDLALTHDATVPELEDRVGDDLAASWELAGDGGGSAFVSRDLVFHRRLDADGGAVLEQAPPAG